MYKKDKQGMIIVLIALTLFLAISIGFKFQSAVVAFIYCIHCHTGSVIIKSASTFNSFRTTVFLTRQRHFILFICKRTVIYTAALVALVAYINHWMWIAGGALLVLLLCLIQTISAFHTLLIVPRDSQANSKCK